MPQIHNSREYGVLMGNASRKALEFAFNKALEDLQKFIKSDVYGTYYPTDYNRTFELYDAWNTSVTANRGTIMFLGALLNKNSTLGQHDSIMGDGSLGDSLLEVIEAGYRGFNAVTGKPIPSRPFWTKWMKRADKMLPKWYAQGLKLQGLTVSG